MIRAIINSDIVGLNKLPPLDWKFDYEAFLKCFLNDDFFHAFVMIQEGQIIGTGNVLIKGKVAWLANIIVAENSRGKGLGGKMTKFLVDFLHAKGCETQLLLATALGEPVYRKLGFKKTTEYHCFDSEIDINLKVSSSIRELTADSFQDVCHLDFIANGEDRKHLIDKFHQNGLGYFNTKNELLGFYLPDFGRGLVVAKENFAGIELLRLKHAEKDRRTMLPIENMKAVDFLVQSSLKKGCHCSKMVLGKEMTWNPAHIYSYGSGYCG